MHGDLIVKYIYIFIYFYLYIYLYIHILFVKSWGHKRYIFFSLTNVLPVTWWYFFCTAVIPFVFFLFRIKLKLHSCPWAFVHVYSVMHVSVAFVVSWKACLCRVLYLTSYGWQYVNEKEDCHPCRCRTSDLVWPCNYNTEPAQTHWPATQFKSAEE